MLAGVPHDDVQAAGRAFGAELARSAITADARDRVAWHRREGHDVVIVSASLDVYLIEVASALGASQLQKLTQFVARRNEIADRYRELLAALPLDLPPAAPPGVRHAYHLFTILINAERAGISRDEFLDAMTREKIGVGVHYRSIPEHPYYQKTFGWSGEDYPHALKIGRETVSLPLSPGLSDADVNDVIAAVVKLTGGAAA